MAKATMDIKRRDYYPIKLCGQTLNLPLFQVNPDLKIAIFNILGETELITKISRELAKKIPKDIEVIITPEVKSVCLAFELSKLLKIPYIVLRKTLKPYMIGSLEANVVSITTGKPQVLYLDGKDTDIISGKKVLLLDDVISTGSTIFGMRKLVKKAGGVVISEAAVFTEGDEASWPEVISLGHLPLFKDEKKS